MSKTLKEKGKEKGKGKGKKSETRKEILLKKKNKWEKLQKKKVELDIRNENERFIKLINDEHKEHKKERLSKIINDEEENKDEEKKDCGKKENDENDEKEKDADENDEKENDEKENDEKERLEKIKRDEEYNNRELERRCDDCGHFSFGILAEFLKRQLTLNEKLIILGHTDFKNQKFSYRGCDVDSNLHRQIILYGQFEDFPYIYDRSDANDDWGLDFDYGDNNYLFLPSNKNVNRKLANVSYFEMYGILHADRCVKKKLEEILNKREPVSLTETELNHINCMRYYIRRHWAKHNPGLNWFKSDVKKFLELNERKSIRMHTVSKLNLEGVIESYEKAIQGINGIKFSSIYRLCVKIIWTMESSQCFGVMLYFKNNSKSINSHEDKNNFLDLNWI
jgi:hypothetical protein